MNRRHIFYFTFLTVVFLLTTTVHASLSEELKDAYQNYRQGEQAITVAEREDAFNRALQIYSAVERGVEAPNAELFANIGNCFYQLGEYGWAVYYYNKSLVLMPRSNEVQRNLFQVKKKAGLIDDAPFSLWEIAPHRFLSFSEQQIIMLLSFAIFIIVTSFFIWIRASFLRRLVWGVGIYCTFIACSFFYEGYLSPVQGVLLNSSSLYRDAGYHYAMVQKEPLLAGETVKVLSSTENGGWLKVNSEHDMVGFIPHSVVRIY